MNPQIREAAANWLVEFRTETVDVTARRQFVAWLRRSPEHIKAYLDLLALWEDAQHFDPQRRLDMSALVALARADRTVADLRTDDGPDGAAETLAPEQRHSRASLARRPILRRLLRPRAAVAALLSLVINFGALWIATDSRSGAYTTQIAEQRSVLLSDGSRVDLDALSNVRVRFTSDERTVELLSGQALFSVTKDPKRPFVVRVDGARLRAVGTQFDVNRTALGTVLTVLEGRVAVLIPAAPASGFFGAFSTHRATGTDTRGTQSSSLGTGPKVEAGQQATILRSAISVPQAVDTAAVTGWTRRLFIFASTPLPIVAEEFNRFNFRRIAIASPELADFHVTGTFRAFDPETLADFVLFLRRQPGLEVIEKDDQITVQSRLAHSKQQRGQIARQMLREIAP
jgi:transmembrane sensor